MTNLADSNRFDEYYYRHSCGLPYERSEPWLRLFGQMADRIVRAISPQSVLDVGCALGFLVEALRARDVEAYGMDISAYAIAHVAESIKRYCWQGSAVEPLPRRYDLIVCIEVLEHLPPADSERALANLCRAADDILFSSTPVDYREVTHVNVQPPEYWAGLFAEQGFVRDVDFDARMITPWAMRQRRSVEPLPRLVANYERKFWRLWQENSELHKVVAELSDQVQVQSRLHDQQLQELNSLRATRSTPAWRLAAALGQLRRFMAPAGSRREHWLRHGLRRFKPVAPPRDPRL